MVSDEPRTGADRTAPLAYACALAAGVLMGVFLLDIPVHIGLGRSGWRAQSKWDRFEVLDPAFHERVREGYLRLAAAEPKRWQVIDAARDEASIAQDVRREVDAFLGLPASLRP